MWAQVFSPSSLQGLEPQDAEPHYDMGFRPKNALDLLTWCKPLRQPLQSATNGSLRCSTADQLRSTGSKIDVDIKRLIQGLLGVHSRYSLHTRAVTVYRDSLSEGFSHFVTSMTASGCFRLERSPGGIYTHWKAPPFHGARQKRPGERRPVWLTTV